jgi:hypothetical protein
MKDEGFSRGGLIKSNRALRIPSKTIALAAVLGGEDAAWSGFVRRSKELGDPQGLRELK